MNLALESHQNFNPRSELVELRLAVENGYRRLEREELSYPVIFGRFIHDADGAMRPTLIALYGKSPVGTPLMSPLEQKAAALAYHVWHQHLLEGRKVSLALLWVESLRAYSSPVV
ncbi:MAG: hypothetical protein H7095_05900 [Pseudopedobacter sp.]|nr:hypothetical protein [Deinococcales bacterium]